MGSRRVREVAHVCWQFRRVFNNENDMNHLWSLVVCVEKHTIFVCVGCHFHLALCDHQFPWSHRSSPDTIESRNRVPGHSHARLTNAPRERTHECCGLRRNLQIEASSTIRNHTWPGTSQTSGSCDFSKCQNRGRNFWKSCTGEMSRGLGTLSCGQAWNWIDDSVDEPGTTLLVYCHLMLFVLETSAEDPRAHDSSEASTYSWLNDDHCVDVHDR